jgi:hypothetical protein
MKMKKNLIFFIKIMESSHQLLSLIQQQLSNSGQGSGIKYKIFGNYQQEYDVPLDNFNDYINNMLAFLSSNIKRYYQKRSIEDDTFNPLNYSICLCEKIIEHACPIIVDINLEFCDQGNERFFKDIFIYKCIYNLQDIILGVFNIEITDDDVNKNLICFVLESDIWSNDEKQYKNIRFHFPFTKVNTEHLNKVIIANFKKLLMEDDNIMRNCMLQIPSLGWEQMIPDMGEYVSLYGCSKTPNSGLFNLRGIYSHINDVDLLSDDIEDERSLSFYIDYSNNNLTIPEEHSLINKRYIEILSLEQDRIYNLPLILSIYYYDKILKINPNINISPIVERKSPEKKLETAYESFDDFKMLNELLPMISKSRYTTYYKYYWYSIGKSIHNIYNGTPMGLNIFEQLTDDVELKELCGETYNGFCSEILDIRTIRQYAKTDNLTLYNSWHKKIYESKIQPALSKQSLDVGKLAADFFCLDFVYDRRNNTWFHFDGTRLVKDSGGFKFINALNTKLVIVFDEYRTEITNKSRDASDRSSKQYYENIIKNITDVIYKLSDLTYVEKILKACQVLMYDDNLYVKTDEDPMIMACKDSIIECYDDNITSRPGKLQDYITKSTNISFPSCYDISHPKVQFMLKYYGQVHTERDLCHFFLKHLGSLLKGGNAEKYFVNWIGEANASKSQVLKFLQHGIGEYCVPLQNHLITLNINSNSGRPEPSLERAKGSRAAVVAETDRSEKFHVGNIKKFTGNDTYENRTLNKEGGERSLSFQLIGMSNIDNDAPNADEAFYSRYVKIPFGSKWVDDAPLSEEEQYRTRRFKIDLDFSHKIRFYAQAQLYLMFYYYPIYRKEGIRILPDIVKRVTAKYQRDLDVIQNFIHNKLQIFYLGDPKDKNLDKTKKTNSFDLHQIYKRWYRSAYGNSVEPLDQFKFTDEMCRRIGQNDENDFWYGISLKHVDSSGSL